MKKFVILFLLLVLSFSTNATSLTTDAAEAITPAVILETVEMDVDLSVSVVGTFEVQVEEPIVAVLELPTEEDIRCLQQNIYFEARNQGTKGMTAVANVTVNRTQDARYPSTICGVVQEKTRSKKGKTVCQFSWFCDSRLKHGPRLTKEEERRAWERAGEIAVAVLEGSLGDVVHGATHYHATYVNPGWSSRLRKTVKIGAHIFYR